MMKEYAIGYNELMDFPFEKYLELLKIMSIEAKEEQKEAERQEREMDRKT